MIAYIYFKELFCSLFHIRFWRDILEILWPSAIDIMTGMRIQIGEDSACMYYVYTLIIFSLNIIAMGAYAIYLLINIKEIIPKNDIDINENYLKKPLIVLLLMSIYIIGMFFIDEYNYGDAKYARGVILSPSSVWGGLWNFLRITIFFGVTSYLSLTSITILSIYMIHKHRDKNANGRR